MADDNYRQRFTTIRPYPGMQKSRVPLPPYFNGVFNTDDPELKKRQVHLPLRHYKYTYGNEVCPVKLGSESMVGGGSLKITMPTWQRLENARRDELLEQSYQTAANYNARCAKSIDTYIDRYCQPEPTNKWVLRAQQEAEIAEAAEASGINGKFSKPVSYSKPGSARGDYAPDATAPTGVQTARPGTRRPKEIKMSATRPHSARVSAGSPKAPKAPHNRPHSARFYGAQTTANDRRNFAPALNYNPNPSYPSYPFYPASDACSRYAPTSNHHAGLGTMTV